MVSQAWAKHAPRAAGHLGCAARMPEVTTMGMFQDEIVSNMPLQPIGHIA